MNKEKERPVGPKEEMARVCYAADAAAADRIMEILRSAGIEAAREGGTRDIYKAGSLMGEEILVPFDDLEEARRLLREENEMAEDAAGTAAGGPGGREKQGLWRQIAIAAVMVVLLMLLAGLVGTLPGR